MRDTETNGSQALQLLARFNQTPNLIESIKALVAANAEVNHTDNRRWGVLHHLARIKQIGKAGMHSITLPASIKALISSTFSVC